METKNYINEEWKPIKCYEGLYEISNFGRVKRLGRIEYVKRSNGYSRTKQEKILKPKMHNRGYLQVSLYKNNKMINAYIHRLVAQAFIKNPNNYPCVNHKDEDKANNHVSNLEWCTIEYNDNYGTRNKRQGEKVKGRYNGPNSKQVRCVETNIVYPSAAEAGRQLKISSSHISQCCIGKRNKCNGYHWEYAA